MASQLETAIARFRSRLLAHDEATLTEVTSSYVEVRTTLLKRIERLTVELESEDAPSVSELMQWDRAKTLLAQTEQEMAALAVRMQPVVTAGQQTATALAVESSLGLAAATAATVGGERAAARLVTSWNRLNTGAVEAMVGRLSDGSPLSQWIAQFGEDAAAIMRQELTASAALGRNPRATAARLTKMVDVSGARLLTLARTAQMEAYRDAQRFTYEQNRDVLSGVMRIGALSDRTCGACLALSGTTYEVGYRLESHPNCRCTLIPLVKGISPPELQSGEQYFASLPPKRQDAILGATGGIEYRSGRVTLRDFVVRDEDPKWGSSFRQGSVAQARQSASARLRDAA